MGQAVLGPHVCNAKQGRALDGKFTDVDRLDTLRKMVKKLKPGDTLFVKIWVTNPLPNTDVPESVKGGSVYWPLLVAALNLMNLDEPHHSRVQIESLDTLRASHAELSILRYWTVAEPISTPSNP